MWLRQSTASQEILLGRFVDDADGNTEEIALTIANTDIKLWFEGGTTLSSKNSGGATHIANGLYYTVLDATDTATLGKLEVHVHVSGALAVKREYMVLPAMIYDSMVLGTDRLDTNVTHVADTAQTARDLGSSVLLSSGTGTGQVKLSAGYIAPNWGDVGNPSTSVNLSATTVGTAAAVTTVNGLAADVITAAAIAADAIGSSELATSAVDEIVDAVWNEVLSGHLTAGTTGNALNAASSAGDPWATVLPGAYGANTAGRIVGRSLPDVVAGAAGGLFLAGSNAATTLASLTVSGATTLTGNLALAAGLTVTQSTAGSAAVSITGNAAGAGVSILGGTSGVGLAVQGGASAGHAATFLTNASSYSGIVASGTGTGHGCRMVGGVSGNGLKIEQGLTADLLTVTSTTSLATVMISGVTTFNSLVVSGATTLTGAVTAANASNSILGVALSSSERNSIATALLDLASGVESGKTLREALRVMAAVLAGKHSNSGTASEQFDAIGNPGTARVVGNLNASGDGTPVLTP